MSKFNCGNWSDRARAKRIYRIEYPHYRLSPLSAMVGQELNAAVELNRSSTEPWLEGLNVSPSPSNISSQAAPHYTIIINIIWHVPEEQRRTTTMVWLVEEEKTTRVRVYLWWPSTSSSAWMAYRCFCLVVYWKNEWMVPGERSSSLLFNVRESRRSLVPPSLNYNILGVAFKFKQNNHKSLRALFSPECMYVQLL